MTPSKFTKFTCKVCGKAPLRKQTYEAHMKTHSDVSSSKEKPFTCTACDKAFGSKAWLTRHQKTHSTLETGDGEQLNNDKMESPPRSESENGPQGQSHGRNPGYESSSGDMFMVLPMEIWCMILENIQYYNDLLNMLKAFPQLDGICRRKKQLYLFEHVIPQLAEWMDERDLLNCRLASKQWSLGVDTFLENHPFHRPHHPNYDRALDIYETVQTTDPIIYSKCYHGQKFPAINRCQILFKMYMEQTYSFFETQEITDFMLKMEGHPPEINQFLGRSVEFIQEDGGLWISFAVGGHKKFIEDFWTAALTFLEKWGRHIWFLKIVRTFRQGVTHFLKSVQQSLRHVPNLKSLHINGYWGTLKQLKSKYVNFSENLPELPHLETIHTSWVPFAHPVVTKMLLPHYANQIRRVELHVTISDMVRGSKRKYTSMEFPNLTELRVIDIDTREPRWINGVNNIILSIGAPQVHSLDLRGWLPLDRETVHLKNSEMFRWLERFPLLKHFSFPNERIAIDISDPGILHTGAGNLGLINTTLEFICLHIATLKYNPDILLGFPSLQCLQLCANTNVPGHSGNEEEQLRSCAAACDLETFGEVFKNLRRLKVIIIITGEGDVQRRFRFLKADVEKFLNKREGVE